ncbi:hypothetical protein KP78_17400 [Jeotgalibacillus soli]|uniref:Uncharacterized protein n=1 Tax=Jeotgalibacillus soli TaxID=889306 RepID=A0A0C2VWD2_9BACL|nr:hypothetical protein KP78_17400 [Jeotgalibacillus soli]
MKSVLVKNYEGACIIFKLGFNPDDKKLIEEAKQFIFVFEKIEERLSNFSVSTDPQRIQAFNNQVYQAVASIWAYKRKVLGLILRCELRSNNYALLVDHTSREAAYFANRLKELNEGKINTTPDAIIQEMFSFLKSWQTMPNLLVIF